MVAILKVSEGIDYLFCAFDLSRGPFTQLAGD